MFFVCHLIWDWNRAHEMNIFGVYIYTMIRQKSYEPYVLLNDTTASLLGVTSEKSKREGFVAPS